MQVSSGTLISAASTFGSGTPAGTNLNSSDNIFGFRFQNETAANQIQYGWMRISLSTSTFSQPRAIVEYAYEDSGAGITAGTVPAPTAGMAVLALGGMGLLGRRRK